jgi:glycerol transport system ATP-binding protein
MTLTLEHITKNVGADTHLYDLSLNLEPGLNVLLGPTQAGKTSIMRIMAGLDKPTTGRLLIDGRDMTGVAVQKRSVAFVYQQFVNYPSFTVFDNIASPLRLKGSSAEEIKQQVQSVAEMMHIDHLLDRLPVALSGGQQQRTAIARALVKQADLLLLDEPLVNLDYKLREELRAEMLEIFTRRNSIVVYATTEPLEALMLGGTTSVMDAGRLLQSGSTLEVFHRPNSVRVAEVFSDPPMNLIPAQIEDGKSGLVARLSSEISFPLPEHMRLLSPGAYKLGIRANHAKLSPSSTSINMPTKVELADISGSETYVHASTQSLRLVVQLTGVHSFNHQQEITVALEPNRLFAFDAGGVLQASPNRNSSIAAKVVA